LTGGAPQPAASLYAALGHGVGESSMATADGWTDPTAWRRVAQRGAQRAVMWAYDQPALRSRLGSIKIRHLVPFLRYNSPRKLANLVRVEAERRQRREVVSGWPYVLCVDPSNLCNLTCPACPTGRRDPLPRGMARRLDLDRYRKVLDAFAPQLYLVHLYLWGEPLLNRNIVEFVRYAEQRGVGTNLSSNLNKLRPGLADELVSAGLGHLVVSISGAPFIEGQYIVFEHNKHETEQARARLREAGADYVVVRNSWGDGEGVEQPKEVASGASPSKTWRWRSDAVCHQLYSTMVIHPDGSVGPCCMHEPRHPSYANAIAERFEDYRNNARYRASRQIFAQRRIDPATAETVFCAGCTLAKGYVAAAGASASGS
jgi:MoaA/NifB/PqqE/SkfB family radical SAM enzyme